ncbi:hypothetical protein PR048_025351 [Dryococelus australis]|uniref:Tc1-like transposase DDE domain-containing protein n=1 Tax=Dryococelus australis TaxID=614101 RepID=A0ABQ9GR67_9NEOP|nr:hypothetical protein PR048_025351 [Dryococelus australis]
MDVAEASCLYSAVSGIGSGRELGYGAQRSSGEWYKPGAYSASTITKCPFLHRRVFGGALPLRFLPPHYLFLPTLAKKSARRLSSHSLHERKLKYRSQGAQDDNARCHVSRATMQWYADNNVRRLDWPAQSPDLNPIEHLWDELDRRVMARQAWPKSMEWLQEEWRRIPVDVLQTLVESMPDRVVAVIAARGATVAERLACSPPTKANRAQSPAGPPDFHKWESCRTMPLVGESCRESPVSPAAVFNSITLIGSQDLAVKSRPNLFIHSSISRTVNRSGVKRPADTRYLLEAGRCPSEEAATAGRRLRSTPGAPALGLRWKPTGEDRRGVGARELAAGGEGGEGVRAHPFLVPGTTVTPPSPPSTTLSTLQQLIPSFCAG